MTKDEFIAAYCANSDVTPEWLQQHMTAVPCACNAENCKGWAMVNNDPDVIKHHEELYNKRTRSAECIEAFEGYAGELGEHYQEEEWHCRLGFFSAGWEAANIPQSFHEGMRDYQVGDIEDWPTQEEIEINGQKFVADVELIPLLEALNAAGLTTIKHCAGHSEDEPAWIVLSLKNVEKFEFRNQDELKIMWRKDGSQATDV